MFHSENLEYLSDNDLYPRSASSIERLVVSKKDVQLLLDDIGSMLGSIDVPRPKPKDIGKAFTKTQLLKSLQVCRLKDTASTIRFLNLSRPREALPRCYTVQLTLVTMSLLKQPGLGLLFAVLLFDPSEGESVGASFKHSREDTWTDGLFGFHREGEETPLKHTRWRQLMEGRKRHHLEQVCYRVAI
jgi:hypothetical protein